MKRAPVTPRPANLPHVASFECGCGTVHNSHDGLLAVGWTRSAGTIFCADCTRAGIASRRIASPPPHPSNAEKVRLRGEVAQLLREGQTLMPLNGKKRIDWVDRVNSLMADFTRSAA